jgi:hypothetical protein
LDLDQLVWQAKAQQKTEVSNRFAIAEDDDDVSSAVELTLFQASAAAVAAVAAAD